MVSWITVIILAACSQTGASADHDANAIQFHAFEQIRFPSLETSNPSGSPLLVTGYLFRPQGDSPRSALVLLHGCGGMLKSNGAIYPSYLDWANQLVAADYVVMLVDSFTPRGVRNMCAPSDFQGSVARARPKDAYGALLYLQGKSFVRPGRIGLIGWSQGGGTVLRTIPIDDRGARPVALPEGDFRAAVAFYPGGCNEQQLGPTWSTKISLLMLVGGADVWSPAEPCKTALDAAAARGSHIESHIYPSAYHAFDTNAVRVHPEPGYRTSAGVVPIVGTDPAARDDALLRVPEFLRRYLEE